jgi:putative tricarboxylic transport membrane protein
VVRVARNALVSGLVLVGLGLFFGYTGRGLATTQSGGMLGPGYFPQVLSALLLVLGLAILLSGVGRRVPGRADRRAAVAGAAHAALPWRALVLLPAALLWFALAVRPLGVGPALAGALLLACYASPRSRLLPSLLLTGLTVLFVWAVFIRALRMPVALLGPWFN